MDRKQESGTSEANVVYGRTGKLLGAAFLIGMVINLFDNRPVSRLISAWIPFRTWRFFLILPYLPWVALGVLIDALIDWHYSINRNLFPLEIVALWILTLPLVTIGLYLGRR